MSKKAVFGRTGGIRTDDECMGRPGSAGGSDAGVIAAALGGIARLYAVPPACVPALLVAGVVLGAIGDALLRAPGPPGLNLSLWIAAVAIAALAVHRRAAPMTPGRRVTWLAIGVVFAAGFTWRDAELLKLLALGCATLAFALAAHRLGTSWVHGAGVCRYAGALALGVVHVWTAAALALVDAKRFRSAREAGRPAGWRRAAAVVRGLAIAAPLVLLFGALLMAADAVFAELVSSAFRFDFEWTASHILLFSVLAWISTGYLRGFLTGTDLPFGRESPPGNAPSAFAVIRPTLGATEVATALTALDLLFLLFVIVQFRYLFGGDALVQITPDLTYAEYARRGFFELVFVVVLVVPVLLSADWLLDRRTPRAAPVFRSLAGVQLGLVLAIAASAFQRLRLYHASYGLTEARFYAMALLIWIAAMLFWFAATVLRGRREPFAFGALASGLATVALLFVVNPDAIVARTNVARLAVADAPGRFDVAYATSLSADAVPVLIAALPTLPAEMQCPLAQRMLRRWGPERRRSMRSWNWSAARASDAVRTHESHLRTMVGSDQVCAAP
jgi:hypothetical protein